MEDGFETEVEIEGVGVEDGWSGRASAVGAILVFALAPRELGP
jgi:hypothetical protein